MPMKQNRNAPKIGLSNPATKLGHTKYDEVRIAHLKTLCINYESYLHHSPLQCDFHYH